MELIYPVDREKYDRLIDVLCRAGIDERKAEQALCTYVPFWFGTKADRHHDDDVRVLTFEEWAHVCDAMEPFTSDIIERVEQAWKKASSRWWTAESVILGR